MVLISGMPIFCEPRRVLCVCVFFLSFFFFFFWGGGGLPQNELQINLVPLVLISDPGPLIEKSRASCPSDRFPPSFIHQVIIIMIVFSSPPRGIPVICQEPPMAYVM